MLNISFPAFGEQVYTDHIVNSNTCILTISDSTADLFEAYGRLLEENQFVSKEKRYMKEHLFSAYSQGTYAIFLNYYVNTSELMIVVEKESAYFSYVDTMGVERVQAEITQVHLEDFGMSYVVRLSDGRFIIIDGGREFAPDAERLMQCLRNSGDGNKPVIAAWILTHPHADHYRCFINFVDRFAEEVTIEKVLLNFPEADDFEHYPTLAKEDKRFQSDEKECTNIPRMYERINRTGAAVYTPHTGQTYVIGDAVCEILASMDDTIHCSQNVNATSLVIRMKLAGQVILWTADASFSDARLAERYGTYLAADILQVPHHGFGSGLPEPEIEGYRLIQAPVCLLPVSDYNAYTVFCAHRPACRFLMTKAGVHEMITGEETRTISLPYTPATYGVQELRDNYLSGMNNTGAYTWVFCGLNTANQNDFVFSIVNMTSSLAKINIELFFENSSEDIRFIKAEILPGTFKKICIVDEEDIQGDVLYFNSRSLKKQGIPEATSFAVRFMSNIPVVVSHRDYIASYHS